MQHDMLSLIIFTFSLLKKQENSVYESTPPTKVKMEIKEEPEDSVASEEGEEQDQDYTNSRLSEYNSTTIKSEEDSEDEMPLVSSTFQ